MIFIIQRFLILFINFITSHDSLNIVYFSTYIYTEVHLTFYHFQMSILYFSYFSSLTLQNYLVSTHLCHAWTPFVPHYFYICFSSKTFLDVRGRTFSQGGHMSWREIANKDIIELKPCWAFYYFIFYFYKIPRSEYWAINEVLDTYNMTFVISQDLS